MNDNGAMFIALIVLVGSVFWLGFILGINQTHQLTMKEAFDRGYAFECLGKEGYHWECADD